MSLIERVISKVVGINDCFSTRPMQEIVPEIITEQECILEQKFFRGCSSPSNLM